MTSRGVVIAWRGELTDVESTLDACGFVPTDAGLVRVRPQN